MTRARLYGVSKEDAKKRIDELLEAINLTDKHHQKNQEKRKRFIIKDYVIQLNKHRMNLIHIP